MLPSTAFSSSLHTHGRLQEEACHDNWEAILTTSRPAVQPQLDSLSQDGANGTSNSAFYDQAMGALQRPARVARRTKVDFIAPISMAMVHALILLSNFAWGCWQNVPGKSSARLRILSETV